MVKNLPAMQETQVQSLSQEDPLEKKMVIHSSILAWRIPWTEEPGRLQSMGLRTVGHDWATRHIIYVIVETFSISSVQFSSVAQSCPTLCNPMNCSTPGLPVHHQPGVHSNSHPSSRWCHPAISSSVVPFSSCPQSLPASESFPMSQFFAWGDQSIGVSALASFLPNKSQGWSHSEWTGWISLQSKGLSRVFSNTTVQKHQFFGSQLSSQSNSQIHTWPLEKP